MASRRSLNLHHPVVLFPPFDLLLEPLEPPLVPLVAGVEADEGPGEGVVHQAGDVHRGQTGPSCHHNQLAGIEKYQNILRHLSWY